MVEEIENRQAVNEGIAKVDIIHLKRIVAMMTENTQRLLSVEGHKEDIFHPRH